MQSSVDSCRRFVLCGLVCSATCATCALLSCAPQATQKNSTAQAAESVLPVLMFHKVEDTPQYPEDISPQQAEVLFRELWSAGYRPVNVSDILTGRVDTIVPRGCKPIAITADDSHRSMLFAQKKRDKWGANDRSFMDIFRASLAPFGIEPRASFFLSRVNDDRVSKDAEQYFGGNLPLREIVQKYAPLTGIEFGYHTATHTRMSGMGASEVRALLEAQQNDFRSEGVFDDIAPVLAYPYGRLPFQDGVDALRGMGFLGAVLAFPGVGEAVYEDIPRCFYNAYGLQIDPLLIPRVAIGAWTYSQKGSTGGAYQAIDPLDDFHKDIERGIILYVSHG